MYTPAALGSPGCGVHGSDGAVCVTLGSTGIEVAVAGCTSHGSVCTVLDWATLGSASLGSALLGSSSLGSARIVDVVGPIFAMLGCATLGCSVLGPAELACAELADATNSPGRFLAAEVLGALKGGGGPGGGGGTSGGRGPSVASGTFCTTDIAGGCDVCPKWDCSIAVSFPFSSARNLKSDIQSGPVQGLQPAQLVT